MMLMELTETPVADLPIAAFKSHLRQGSGFTEEGLQDAVLESFLRAALAAIEARTGKVLLSRSFAQSVTQWRDGTGHGLPMSPVEAIEDVTLIDRDGGERVVDPAIYRLVQDSQEPRLMPVATLLPMIPNLGSARITLRAGLSPDWDGLPADLRQAVMLLAAHYYEYRDETALRPGCMPFGVSSLIERHRILRLRGGGLS